MSMDVTVGQSVPDTNRATAATIAGLAHVPASFKAMALICLSLKGGALAMSLPNGRSLVMGEGPIRALMKVNEYALARRVFSSGDIGFAESFMAGEWDTPDLTATLTFLADNAERLGRIFRGNPVSRAMHWMRHQSRANTKEGARQNILDHYDLGNAFYQLWLDPSMTYSSARFDRTSAEADLTAAQAEKYRSIARLMNLQAGERVLEIGCGWGGFAEVAAKEYGAKLTGVTLSDAQLAFAKERMAKAGLTQAVDLRIQDYRDVEGPFDKVASIEMFEAVGEEYWSTYFAKIAEVLRSGGKASLQIITIRDDLFDSYRSRADFIQRYIFPGGMLPSVTRLKEEVAKAGLVWEAMESFGPSYARTLREWSARFVAQWENVRPLGFDDRFKQLWRFYLSYCEAGFLTGRTNVVQVALAKP
jgi:cyclopropane-fatty-acyl-phospholipid synthase